MHYEPSAPEAVGGDFYDLFPLAAGRSGFFLGDVCGKGPDAAAVTSLARYTMRTAAMLHERPEAILMDLNAALLMDENELTPMCTVVYGQVDVDEQSAAITLAVAGLPPPLLVRAGGSVKAPRPTARCPRSRHPLSHLRGAVRAGRPIVICSDGILDAKSKASAGRDRARPRRGKSRREAQDLSTGSGTLPTTAGRCATT